mgnify:FL=1
MEIITHNFLTENKFKQGLLPGNWVREVDGRKFVWNEYSLSMWYDYKQIPSTLIETQQQLKTYFEYKTGEKL